ESGAAVHQRDATGAWRTWRPRGTLRSRRALRTGAKGKCGGKERQASRKNAVSLVVDDIDVAGRSGGEVEWVQATRLSGAEYKVNAAVRIDPNLRMSL